MGVLPRSARDENEAVPPPGPAFNFAGHLIELNAGRSDKLAYVDDHETLSYGELADRIRRMASALVHAGLRREDRVLLLMHDNNDWPVSFLGAMYAGIVPVAVNTLLTADDYAYMLTNSRAQGALVSAALLPTLSAAMAKGDNDVRVVMVSRPDGELPASTTAIRDALARHDPLPSAAATSADDPGL